MNKKTGNWLMQEDGRRSIAKKQKNGIKIM